MVFTYKLRSSPPWSNLKGFLGFYLEKKYPASTILDFCAADRIIKIKFLLGKAFKKSIVLIIISHGGQWLSLNTYKRNLI
jgi:hypothetical protein